MTKIKMKRQPNTQYVLSYSYGKDSGATIHIVKDILGWPLDRIVTADVWATDTIPADLPEMWAWKQHADEVIFKRWGIPVEHFCATQTVERKRERENRKTAHTYEEATKLYSTQPYDTGSLKETSKDSRQLSEGGADISKRMLSDGRCVLTYEDIFYTQLKPGSKTYQRNKKKGKILGFPIPLGNWCNGLKRKAISFSSERLGAKINTVQYLGIAADEPIRIERHQKKPGILLPMVEAGWTEQMARDWCEANDLLAPTYKDSSRGGCWFCHNQGVDQLRKLRKNYPELWALMLKWDDDSPVTFKTDGHTVHDFDRRFQAEDDGYISNKSRFYWNLLDNPTRQLDIFDYYEVKENG